MDKTQELLKKLHSKYHDRIVSFEEEHTINKKYYILTYSNNYTYSFAECGGKYACNDISEAINFIKYALTDISEERNALIYLGEEIYDNIKEIDKKIKCIEHFVRNNLHFDIHSIMNDYSVLVNKDYDDKSTLYLKYEDLYLDNSCKRIILKIRGENAFI